MPINDVILMLRFCLYNYIASCISTSTRNIVLWKAEYPEMENDLYKWFELQKESHVTFTNAILSKNYTTLLLT